MSYSWLIVGAGFTGATLAERLASQAGQKVLVIDKRDHIGGNAFDFVDRNGLCVHRYGPHIFHTNSQKVWDYLSAFTRWKPYFHRVLGAVEGQLVPLPFNLDSLAALFPAFMAETLAHKLIQSFGFGKNVPILTLRESQDADMRFLADYVYRHVFETYTRKQWDLRPEDLSPSVTARVPIRISRDDRYFQDTYQALPAQGYAQLFKRMLSHRNIKCLLRTDFAAVRDRFPEARVIFTGPLDSYFSYAHGALPYRSLRFETEGYDEPGFVQEAGTINYPESFDFTRITEMKRLTGQQARTSVLIREYPQAHEAGKNEPYYPVPTPDTAQKLAPYLEKARALDGKVWFAGRLGDYAYYNMDQAVARALALFEKIEANEGLKITA